MTNHDLFLALNYVRPEYLACSEAEGKQPRRIPRRLALTAAVAALLACSVLAGITVANHIKNARSEQTNRPAAIHDLQGTVQIYEGMADISLSLHLMEERPAKIEAFYVPLYFAENWEMEAQIRPAHQENREAYLDTRLMWQDGAGGYAEFTQCIVDARIPADCAEYPFDCVSTGYNESCQTENLQLGQYSLFCVTVPPSSAELDNQTVCHDGLRKFYWSDGNYLFTLEVSYDVSDAVVEQALESLTTVPDITTYETVHYIDPEPVAYEAQITTLVPREVPDGWQQLYGEVAPDGCYNFAWRGEADNWNLELTQVRTGSQTGLLREWETTTEDCAKFTYTIQSWDVVIYQRENKLQAFWHVGEADYVLTLRGRGEHAVDDMVAFIDNLELTDTPETWLMES